MTRHLTAIAIVALVFLPATAFAQANPFSDAVKAQLAQIKTPITRTAEKVGEDLYAFKPTPDVRSLGQLIDLTQSGQVLQSSAMVGRQVEAASPQLALQNGAAKIKFTAAADGPVAVAVYGANGSKIADGLVQASAGSNEWSWNGRNGNGTLMRDGAYTVAVAGSNADGSTKALPFTVLGTATGVSQTNGTIRLQLGGLTINFSDVKSVAPEVAK